MRAKWVLGLAMAISAAMLGTGEARADKYGAIAFSMSTGAHGWANDFGSRAAAETTALQNCRRYAGDCSVVSWFRNACGALAVGSGNAYGTSWGSTRQLAEQLAMRECTNRAGGCGIRRWVCTGR